MDPILAAHLVRGRCFEVGGEFSPASIRDQMVRAYLVVDRAYQAGLIDRAGSGRDLLVIGGGPSGLSAAVRAAELGVRTLLIEKRKRQPFRLARCRSRYVEPTLYDWALGHWTQDVFNWTGAQMEFRWRADWADRIALRWRRRIPSILKTYSKLLTISYGTTPVLARKKLPPVTNAKGYVTVDLKKGGATSRRNFGAVVSCVGLGRENVQAAPSYRGFDFWRPDDFQSPDCGLATPPRILISGGGDGGLQDFIRVMTQLDTGSVFDAFCAALAHAPELLDAVAGDIQDAEDVAARALCWNLPKHDHAVFRRLEAAHERAIDDLETSPLWPAIVQAVGQLIPTPVPMVTLAHRGEFFTQCYPLNRFLSLLMLRILKGGAGIRLPNTDVEEVRCAHGGPTNAKACHGQLHTVRYKTGGVQRTADFEVVIIRHGVLGPRSLFSGPGPAHVRQLLPYFVEA